MGGRKIGMWVNHIIFGDAVNMIKSNDIVNTLLKFITPSVDRMLNVLGCLPGGLEENALYVFCIWKYMLMFRLARWTKMRRWEQRLTKSW